MAKKSAGILRFRSSNGRLELFLVHPGGPFWKNKDNASWSIPKGEYDDGEDPFDAANREFTEETGFEAITGDFKELGELKQPSGKLITAWAVEGECNPQSIRSNTFSMEWPPRSGKQSEFPEIDRADWFSVAKSKEKLHKGQVGFVDRLCEILAYDPTEEPACKSEDKQTSLF